MYSATRSIRGPGGKLQIEAPCVCDRSEKRGRKAGSTLIPCRLLLFGGSLNIYKEGINKILILVDEAPWTLRPEAINSDPSCKTVIFISR